MRVANNHIVSFRYCMRDEAGNVLENTMNGAPVSYLQGGNAILPALQQQLNELQAGDIKQVVLAPGEQNKDAFYFDVIIDAVRAALPHELILGYPVQTDVGTCNEDCDCYGTGSRNGDQPAG